MTLMKSLFFALALSVAACATTGSGGGAGASGGNPAAAAVAAKLGVDEKYVSIALQAAQGALGGNQAATPEAKDAAAQQGVDKAAAAAQADGKPLSDDQKGGLLDGLKGLL